MDTDVNFMSVYGGSGKSIDGTDLTAVDGSKFDSPLKISHSTGIVGTGLKIPQGTENAVDINVCHGVSLEGEFGSGSASGDQVITIKGGSSEVKLSGNILSRGKRMGVEVEIGNWSDQSYAMTQNTDLDLTHVDGGPVWVAIGWAFPFTTKLGGSCKYAPWGSIKLKAYWIFKFLVRTVCRIHVGEKGPAWL